MCVLLCPRARGPLSRLFVHHFREIPERWSNAHIILIGRGGVERTKLLREPLQFSGDVLPNRIERGRGSQPTSRLHDRLEQGISRLNIIHEGDDVVGRPAVRAGGAKDLLAPRPRRLAF